MTGALFALLVLLGGPAGAGTVDVHAGPRTFRMDPSTLALESSSVTGNTLKLSTGQPGLGAPIGLMTTATEAGWDLPRVGLSVALSADGETCVVRLTLSRSGEVTWPVVAPDSNIRGLILPRGEGHWVPPDDPGWAEILADENALTEEFSLPCWGLDLGGQTVTYLVPDPFGARVRYARRQGRIGFAVTRMFTRLDAARAWEVRITFGPGSPVAPALEYRRWLQATGRFIPLSARIAEVPRTERLLGAVHAYCWGIPFQARDVKDWKAFIRTLEDAPRAASSTPLGRCWTALPPSGRLAAVNLVRAEWKHEYVKSEAARALADLLARRVLDAAALAAAFPGSLRPPDEWGGAISPAFLRELAGSGVDRACLVMHDLHAADTRPEVARLAESLGYLCGPYDSYNGVHPPGMKDTWETAQFDQALYDSGGVLREDGTYLPGYQRKGRETNAAAVRPYLERRVREIIGGVPYNAWFVDCDAYGQYFDDFSPLHPAPQAADCAARVDRMQWIARTFGTPVGSEGGFALAAPGICFAHGVLTPAIGWGDKDLTDKSSPWWLGGWWPPEAPDVFFMKVPLKPRLLRAIYDSRYRLPLYQAALHDSVVATHHWSTPSFKVKGTEAATALIEQLYNVPPLYHFSRESFAKDKARILAHYAFFSPLHRRLALVPLTGFSWLTPDRLVQRTIFADGTELTANFGGRPWRGEGLEIPARTVVSRWQGAASSYTPPDN